jgi:hypothetical protein
LVFAGANAELLLHRQTSKDSTEQAIVRKEFDTEPQPVLICAKLLLFHMASNRLRSAVSTADRFYFLPF